MQGGNELYGMAIRIWKEKSVMGLLGSIIAKGVMTAAKNSTIRAVGHAAATVITAKEKNPSEKDDIVVKNGVALIRPTRASENYWGENALEIARELLGGGFESVTLKPVSKLSERAKKRYGKVEAISINGNNDFSKRKKVPASSYIVIEYLDFKKTVNVGVYASVARITPGIMNRNQIQVGIQDNSVTPIGEVKKFCPYCGNALTIIGAKFCSSCGNAI